MLQTDGQRGRQAHGWTDRSEFIGPSGRAGGPKNQNLMHHWNYVSNVKADSTRNNLIITLISLILFKNWVGNCRLSLCWSIKYSAFWIFQPNNNWPRKYIEAKQIKLRYVNVVRKIVLSDIISHFSSNLL